MIFLKKILSLRNKKFVRDASVLQLGSIFSTGLSFLASIVYARILGINGYANYALIFAFVSLTGIFMNVGTNETAITLLAEAYAENNREKIKNLLTYYIKITFLFALVVGLIIIIFAPFLTSLFYHNREIGRLARIVVIGNISQIFFYMYTIVLQIMRKIKNLTIVENLNKIFGVVVPVSLVLAGFGLKGLVFGYLVVTLCFALFSILAYRRLWLRSQVLPSWLEIIGNLRRVKLAYYFKFGFLIAVDKNLGSLYSTLPIFILGMFSFDQVAFFKIATAYAGLPSILISPVSRLLMVQLPKSKIYSLAILKRDFVRSSFGGFLITFGAALVLVFLAPILIPLVYGQSYLFAICLSYPLLLGTVISSWGLGLSSIFRTLNLMKKSIIINFVLIVAGSGLLCFLAKNYSINVSVWAIALWLPLATMVFFFYVLNYMNKKIKVTNETGE
ncbi:MAG: oligosaccharide flippase family protein [Patescibacteria group bacterium]